MKPFIVLGKRVPIKDQTGVMSDTNFCAYYDYSDCSITIDVALGKSDYEHTLLHELGHAIFHRAGIHQAKLPPELEEIIVEQFATVFYENFKLTRR